MFFTGIFFTFFIPFDFVLFSLSPYFEPWLLSRRMKSDQISHEIVSSQFRIHLFSFEFFVIEFSVIVFASIGVNKLVNKNV